MNRRMPNGMYGGVRGERKSPLLDLRYSKTGGKQMWKMVIAVLVLLLLAILALVIYFSEK